MHRRHQRLQSIFLVLACGSIAAGQSAGTFTATGSMTTPRFGHTATLLVDGRVLIAGGYTDTWNPLPYPVNGPAVTATAELYDPSTGVFTPTGSMITPRAYHAATLLPDGRVLIAGGTGAGRPEENVASVEIYDPTSGVFTATASLSTPRSNGLPAEIYDPSTAALTPAANSTQPAAFAAGTTTLLFDGRVLIAGYAAATLLPSGQVLFAAAYSSASALYDPAAAAFSPTGDLFAFWNQTALLANGTVLAVGGDDDMGASAGAWVYDPAAGASSATANMNAPRADLTITLLPDGQALITGGSTWTLCTLGQGCQAYWCCIASAEIYGPLAGLFSTTGSMISARAGHTATLLPSGQILIVGGGSGDNSPALSTAELYTPARLIAAPALFSISGDGVGQGAIWHAASGLLASATNPAGAGEILSMYTNNLIDGGLIPPQVAVGGRLAETLYFGLAPGYPGYYQVNFRVPSGVAPGSAVPVRLNYLNRTSNGVSISVQ